MSGIAFPRSLPPVLRSLVALLSGALVGQLLTSVASLLVARALKAGGYGPYAAALSLTTLTAMAFTLGLDGWLLQRGRYGSDALARDVGAALTLRLALGALWLGSLPLLAHALRPAIYPLGLTVLLAATIWVESLLALALTALKARLANRMTGLILALSGAAFLAVTLLLGRLGASASGYAQGRLIVAIAGLLVALIALGRRSIRFGAPRLGGAIARSALPFWLSEALFVLYQRADVTILALRVDVQAVAYYAPAAAVASALYLVPSVAYSVAVPALARRLEQNPHPAALLPRIRLLLGGMALLGLGLALLTAVMARPVVALLLGDSFAPSGGLLQLLAGVLFFKSLSFGAAALLVAGGWQARRTGVQAVAALFSIGANWLLAPTIGVVGVTWLFVASEGLLAAGYLYLVWQWIRRPEAPERPPETLTA